MSSFDAGLVNSFKTPLYSNLSLFLARFICLRCSTMALALMTHHIDHAVQSNNCPARSPTWKACRRFAGALGEFLRDLFNVLRRTGLDSGRSQKHAQMVSRLKGQSKVKADERDSFPKAIRSTSERPASAIIRPDEKPMARWGLKRSRSGLWRLLRLYTQRGRFGGRQGRQFSSFRGKHRLGQLSECMCRIS